MIFFISIFVSIIFSYIGVRLAFLDWKELKWKLKRKIQGKSTTIFLS